MKKSSIFILLIVSLFLVCLTGCSQQDKGSTGSKKVGEDAVASTQQEDTGQSTKDTKNSQATAKGNSDNDTDDKNHHSYKDNYEGQMLNDPENIPEDVRTQMDNLTGKWQLQTPTAGGTSVVKLKFDNIGGFTLATGTNSADGQGSEYAHVGSYAVEGDKLTLSATTGGPSTGDDTYELRMDPSVFEYTFAINAEKTQLTLTPQNDNAKQLTGDNPITLSKA